MGKILRYEVQHFLIYVLHIGKRENMIKRWSRPKDYRIFIKRVKMLSYIF